MSAIVVYTDQAAGLNGSGGRERDKTRAAALPIQRPRGQAHSEHTGRNSAIFVAGVVARVSGEPGARTPAALDRVGNGNRGRLPATEFCGSLRASRTLSFGNARVQACKQSSRRIRQAFHLKSFRPAVAWQEQENTRRIPNVAKPTARPRNLTARGGNVSS